MYKIINYIALAGIMTSSFGELAAFPIEAALVKGPVIGLLIGDHHQATEFDPSYLSFLIRQCKKLQHETLSFMIEHRLEQGDYYKNKILDPQALAAANLLELLICFVEENNHKLGNIKFIASDL